MIQLFVSRMFADFFRRRAVVLAPSLDALWLHKQGSVLFQPGDGRKKLTWQALGKSFYATLSQVHQCSCDTAPA